MGNSGRPKKEGLDRVIKVTVNDEVAEMLDNTVQETGKSKSDILRELIPIVSSKDYEGLIPNTSMEILQKYSEKCWEILHTPGCVFEVDKLSDNMPAFVLVCVRRGLNGPVVSIGTACGEIDLIGLCANGLSNGFPGAGDGLFTRSRKLINRGRVAVILGKVRHHGLCYLWPRPGRRRII